MAENVPPIPYNTPIAGPRGMISDPWGKWFRQVFARIGGNIAPSNSELSSQLSGQVDEIDQSVESIEQRLTALESTYQLGQGPDV